MNKKFITEFIQLNLGKRLTAANTLHKELKQNQLCLLQEPVIRKGRITNVPKTHKQFVPFSTGNPRAAILLPTDLGRQTMVLGSLSSRDSITVRSKINKDITLTLASIYMDNTQEIPGDLITKLTVYAEKERLPMIAGIDSNAHHVAWGHPSTNDRGRKLLQAISANGLIICNTGNKPTFVGKLGHSVIDLTICNPLGLNLIRDWRVNSGKSLSDHEAISFNLEIGQTSSFAFRSLSRCDWTLYHQLIETEISRTPFWFKPVHTAEDLNARQHFISDLMRRCFNTACPLSTGIRRSSIPWWSAELTKAKQTAKALRRKANRTKNNSDWEHYRTANRAYSKLLKQSKRKGWKQFCDELKGTSTLARISKILNKDSQSQGTLNSLKKPNGELTNSPQETLQVISDTLIPEGGHPSPSTAGHKGDDAMIMKILAPHRITRAVQSLQTNKSPGPDEIRNEMIIKAWDFIKDPVRMIFHNSLRLGITPDSWKNNTGIILPKPLKTDYTNPRAFRIISLTSNFQKLLERLILWHLELDLKVPSRLTKNQHGFRKGKSTESAIHILTRRIEDAIATGNYSLGVFLDIEQAFDAISFAAIREALHEANIPSTITEWIHHMVSNRYITLSYCGTSVRKRATKGSPQGGVLSPFLWNITLNTFLSGLGLHNNFVQAFADDLVILIRGICISTIRGIAQLLLNRINSWCYSKGLRLSGIKSTAILFTNKRDITLDKPLKVEDTEVPLVNSTTYLGVTLDRKLNWGPHILAKCDKAIGNLHACRKAVGKTWGITPAGTRWIYNYIILPSLGYNAVSWHHTVERKLYIRTRLETVQRQAALMITRGLNSTPTANLEIMAGLQPINLRIKSFAIKTALRLKLSDSWNNMVHYRIDNTCLSHAHTVEKTLDKIPLTRCCLTDKILTTTVLERRFRTIIEPLSSAIDAPLNRETGEWHIYTDGSKAGNLTGAGFCVYHNDRESFRHSYQLGSLPTVYQCELFALHMASCWASNNIPQHTKITFFSDSQAAIRAISSTNITSVMVLDTTNQLNKLATRNTVEIRWIPGHKGVQGNETADEMARKGSAAQPIGPEPFLPIPQSLIQKQIHDYLFRLHIKQYRNIPISDKGKIPLLTTLQRYKYRTPKLSTAHRRWLTWLLTGHSPLAYFQHRAQNFTSPHCSFCPGEEETSEHFLGTCVGYMTIRLQTLGKCILSLDEIANLKWQNIIKYISESKRFDIEDLFG